MGLEKNLSLPVWKNHYSQMSASNIHLLHMIQPLRSFLSQEFFRSFIKKSPMNIYFKNCNHKVVEEYLKQFRKMVICFTLSNQWFGDKCKLTCKTIFICDSISICDNVCRSVGLSVCRSVGLSVCRSVGLSVCLSVCLSVSMSFEVRKGNA
jgi:hypothetical protein